MPDLPAAILASSHRPSIAGNAAQVDGGSEFEAVFEECLMLNIKLLVLLPRLPKLNGYVEWAHRAHTEEFYEVIESSFETSWAKTSY